MPCVKPHEYAPSARRLKRTSAIGAVVVSGLILGGCGLFSSDKKAEAEAEAAIAQAALIEPVEKVLNIEIGRTRNGYVISATGLAPRLGYGAPELRARRDGRPGPDGFLDYDFVAQAPDPLRNLGEGTPAARRIQAGLQVKTDDLRGARGIRVHALNGGVQMQF